MTISFDEEMRAAIAAGLPNLDNVGEGAVDGPDFCDCDFAPAGHSEADCWDFASVRMGRVP